MKFSNEAKVGILVTSAFIALAVLTIRTGDFRFNTEGYTIQVMFQNVDGVSINSPVMLNGLEVGRVEDIELKDTKQSVDMELTVWLDQGAKIHRGAKAYVKNMGFMGEKYVGITSGDPQEPYLGQGSVIVGDEPADLDKILLDAQTIVTEIKSISTVVNERLTKNEEAIDRIVSNMDSTMGNINSITTNFDERLNNNAAYIDDIVLNLRSASVNLDLFTYDLMQNPWKLLYRTKEQREQNMAELQMIEEEK